MDGHQSIGGDLTADALGGVAKIMEDVIAAGGLSGSVILIWHKGEIVRCDALGKRDIGSDQPMTRDSLFRIASMTKPITSVAALMLVEEGKLKLDDPITKWAPEFAHTRVLRSPDGAVENTYPAPRDITIEDLLTHRSGLAYSFTSIGPIARAYDDALGDVMAVKTSPDEWMKALSSLPLTYAPGERFHYSHATDVLGFIAARAAGTGFRDLLVERIFKPLGMVDTDFYVPPQKRSRAAVVYKLNEAALRLDPVDFIEHDEAPDFCGGGGGLISTADDYLKFARLLLNNGELDGVRLLKPETVALMRTNRLTNGQREFDFLGIPFWMGQGFGLGVSVIDDPEKHAPMGVGSTGAFGWPGAFGTWWQADPVEDLIILYLVQNAIDLSPEAASQLATGQRMGAQMALPSVQAAVYGALRH